MNEIPRETDALLGKWNGGKAKLWAYGSSFQELTFRIEKPGEIAGNLHIMCVGCLSISAPTLMWQNCHFQITKLKDDPLLGATFRVEDQGQNVVVDCKVVGFRENVEPIYYHKDASDAGA